MTPQRQQFLSDKANGVYGSCMITCYASYLDFDVNSCPQFQFLFGCNKPEGFWDLAVGLWLKCHGYNRVYSRTPPEIEDYYFACGLSPRGIGHMVIYKDGVLFHDPHPSNGGVEVDYYEYLDKIKK